MIILSDASSSVNAVAMTCVRNAVGMPSHISSRMIFPSWSYTIIPPISDEAQILDFESTKTVFRWSVPSGAMNLLLLTSSMAWVSVSSI